MPDTPLAAASWTLCRRELIRFFRQPSRIASAMATPLLLWLFLGAGLDRSFAPPTAAATHASASAPSAQSGSAAARSYRAYFFPGTLVLVVLFTSIFSTISVIEDRNAGFLQGVLAAPVPRAAIVLGKVAGGSLVALLQALAYLLLAPASGVEAAPWRLLLALPVLLLIAFALTALGFVFAWRMESVAGFHGVMNLLLMPMWLLSGAFFPTAGAAGWVTVVVGLNPLAYGLDLLRGLLQPDMPALTSRWLGLAIMLVFAAGMFAVAVWNIGWTPKPRVARAPRA